MAYQPRLKICGVTNVDDARLVSSSGADYCGILVEVSFSERSLSLAQARQVASASKIPVVILLCEPQAEMAERVDREIKPYALQLICREPPEFIESLKPRLRCEIWKTIHLPPVAGQASPERYVTSGADALLVDSVDTSERFERLGGTGKVADWKTAATIVSKSPAPVFLAGGINPDNVAKAILDTPPLRH